MSLHNLCFSSLLSHSSLRWCCQGPGSHNKTVSVFQRKSVPEYLWSAGHCIGFYFQEKRWIQRQRYSLKLHRAGVWVLSESKPKPPSSVSPLINVNGWSRGLKSLCVMQRGGLSDGKRLNQVSATLFFKGGIFELRKLSLPKLPILTH